MDNIRIVLMQSSSTSSMLSFNANGKIGSFPSIVFRPMKRKVHAVADAQVERLEIGHVDAESGVARRGIVDAVPAVQAPMDLRRNECFDAENSALRHSPHLVVESPGEMRRRRAVGDVSLNGLRRPIEDVASSNRPAQFQVFRVRPDEWARRACCVPDEELAAGNVGAVPDLLREETAITSQR